MATIETAALTDYQIMLCGKATFTLEASGKRYTYRVKRVDGTHGVAYFVNLLTGPDNTSDYTYLGIIDDQQGAFRLTKASKLGLDTDPVKGITWLVRKLHKGETLPESVRLLWSSKCQRCGRALTVPSSIDARLGPECAGKM